MDDYQRQLLDRQDMDRAFQARFDAQQLAIEQQRYWIWFYQQCDRDDERLRRAAEHPDAAPVTDTWSERNAGLMPSGEITDSYRDLVGDRPTPDGVLDVINAVLSTNDREPDDNRRLGVELLHYWEATSAPAPDDVAQVWERFAAALSDPPDPERMRDEFNADFDAMRDGPSAAGRDVARLIADLSGPERPDPDGAPWWSWFRNRCEDVERSVALFREQTRESRPPPGPYDRLLEADPSEERFAEIIAAVWDAQDLDRVERERIAREIYLWWKWFYAQCDKDLEHFLERARDAERMRPPDEPYSPGYLNRAFMDWALEIIEEAGTDHPLRRLVDPETGQWVSRVVDSASVTVQAGHLTSRHTGATERFALEDSSFNALTNETGEGKAMRDEDGEPVRVHFFKEAVLIGGVPVETRTALMWEREGLFPKGTVAAAPRSLGWGRTKGARQ